MKRALLIVAALVTVMAVSAGTTVATAYVAPQLLPTGPAGSQGPRGPEGPTGPAGVDGVDGKAGRDGEDGLDGSDAASDSAEQDLAPNGMHKPEYEAYCDDLYERWQDGRSMSGGSDDEGQRAIQEYGDALCGQ